MENNMNNRRRWLIAGLVLVALVGLNLYLRGGEKDVLPTAITRGVVTYRGQPLNGGQIRFVTRDPANKVGQASGMIARDGTFSFAGAPVGPVTVTVDTSVRQPEDYFWRRGSKGPKPIYVPARYADPAKSGVMVNLREAAQECNIQLD